MTDWEGATGDRANFENGQSSAARSPAPYLARKAESSAQEISASVRALLGDPAFSKGSRFNSRFVCSQAQLDDALHDVIELAHNGSAALIVERLGKVPTELRAKYEILRNAVQFLGENWCSDSVDFVTLSTAVSRLQCALRKIGRDCAVMPSIHSPTMQILLPASEEHIFAACYLEELARLDGWSVEVCDGDYAERVSSSAQTGSPQAVCLIWCHEAEKAEIEQILIKLRLIVSKKEIFFFSGGPGATTNVGWLKSYGINGVFDCFDTALRVSREMVRGFDCNSPYAPLTDSESTSPSLSR